MLVRHSLKVLMQFEESCNFGIKIFNLVPVNSGEYWKNVYDVGSVMGNTIDFLKRLDEGYDILSVFLGQLSPGASMHPGKMQQVLNQLITGFRNVGVSKLQNFILLEDEELVRLDEAHECLMRNCYWSAVVNSAVAFEHRLYSLLRERNEEKLKNSDRKLKFTLGTLTSIYLNDKSAFDNCIPKKHEPLLKLINEYRIVSAHPKQFQVDRITADGIFNFTLAFLLDEECRLS